MNKTTLSKFTFMQKNLSEHEILIKQRRNPGIKHFNDPNAFIECSNMMDDVCENIDDYNSNRTKS